MGFIGLFSPERFDYTAEWGRGEMLLEQFIGTVLFIAAEASLAHHQPATQFRVVLNVLVLSLMMSLLRNHFLKFDSSLHFVCVFILFNLFVWEVHIVKLFLRCLSARKSLQIMIIFCLIEFFNNIFFRLFLINSAREAGSLILFLRSMKFLIIKVLLIILRY